MEWISASRTKEMEDLIQDEDHCIKWVRRFLFLGAKNVGIAIRIVPVIGARQKYCHGPSAPWPARHNTARKNKPATPVGMTEFGKRKTQEIAGQVRPQQVDG